MLSNRYEIFVRVAATLNLTQVANEMGYTQSAISHSIKTLESDIGLPLVLRSRNGIRLTDYGEALLPFFQKICKDEQILMRQVTSFLGNNEGTLTIGGITSVSIHWTPTIIRRIADEYPKVQVIQTHNAYGNVEKGILSGDLDVGFLSSTFKSKLNFTPLYRDEYMVVIPPNHKYAGWESIPLEALNDEPLIIMDEQDGVEEPYDALSIIQQLQHRNIVHKVNDDALALQLASEGLGITILSKMITDTVHCKSAVKHFATPRYRIIGIATNPDLPPTPLAKLFIEITKEFVAEWAKDYDAGGGKGEII